MDLSGARVIFKMDLHGYPDAIEPLQEVLQTLSLVPSVTVQWVTPDPCTVLTSESLLLSFVYQGLQDEVIHRGHQLWRELLYALGVEPWCLDCLGVLSPVEILGHNNDHRHLWIERGQVIRLGVKVRLFAVSPRREPYFRTFLAHVRSGLV